MATVEKGMEFLFIKENVAYFQVFLHGVSGAQIQVILNYFYTKSVKGECVNKTRGCQLRLANKSLGT